MKIVFTMMVVFVLPCAQVAMASMSESRVQEVKDETNIASRNFDKLIEEFDVAAGITLLQRILESEKNHFARLSLIRLAFENNRITPQDLMYLIEISHCREATQDLKDLFDAVITRRLKADKHKAKMIELLTSPFLTSDASFIEKYVTGQQVISEKQNIIVRCLKSSYLDAFKSIFDALPFADRISLGLSLAVDRQEYTGCSGIPGFRTFEYIPKTYSLFQLIVQTQNLLALQTIFRLKSFPFTLEQTQAGVNRIVNLALRKELPTESSLGRRLYKASLDGDADEILAFLMMGANIDYKSNIDCGHCDGSTSLYVASNNGHEKAVELLCQLGADISAKLQNGADSLFVASEKGYAGVVKVLLKYNAQPIGCIDGYTPIHVAAQNGYEEILRVLIAKFPEGRDEVAHEGETPLFVASRHGKVGCVEILLKSGVDVNHRTIARSKNNPQITEGSGPLHAASGRGAIKIVELLLAYKADIHASCNKNGHTALHVAVINGQNDVVQYLLEKGADVNDTSNDNKLPLDYAKTEEMKKLFEKKHS